jgi:heptosyltransferase-1
MFYDQQVQVPFRCHAVDRSRYIVSSAFDWPLISRVNETIFYPAGIVLPNTFWADQSIS